MEYIYRNRPLATFCVHVNATLEEHVYEVLTK